MVRRKTHEQFIKELEEANPNIEVLGQYVNSRTKIKVKCKIDGHIWEATPNSLLNGHGCPKCYGKNKKLTHKEFMEKFMEKNSNANDIEILGQYKGGKIKIKCRCKKDGYEWEVKPNDLLSKKSGCPKCYGNIKKTHEDFIKEMKEINSDIEILGQYKNSNTKIKCRCKKDGYEWEVKPNNLLSKKSGCHLCKTTQQSIKQTKTHEQFIKELEEINSDIEVLDTYINRNTKIKCRCKKDGYEWEVKPSNLLSNNSGCPKCSGKKQKTHEEFIKELEEINSDIEILGQYKMNKTKIKCRCKIDGYEWEATPNHLLKGHGCPKCNQSKGEKRISRYLEDNEIDFIPQYTFEDCKCKNVLPFDFYIPSLDILIEYDGKQHFKAIEYFGGIDRFIDTKIRDTIKTWYCKKNDIKLIRIPYWNFDNIEEILEKELTLNK